MKRLLLSLLAFCLASTASASIAVFTDGRTMKISDYVVTEETISLTLQSGGTMFMPMARIDRIVDDEIETAQVAEEIEQIAVEGVFPKRSWRFSEDHGPLFKSKYNELIVAAARHFDVDAALVSAVIKAESDYDAKTLSHKGARGLMQLMPATAARFGVSNSFDPEENIYAGTRYLHWLLQTFDGNADLAVAAYNAGEGNIWKYDGVPPFRETVNYINRIAAHIRRADEAKSSPVASASR